ncbi:TIGR03619 family F420-dependent LLM class oxidoreductase [Bailinhaonella thermotolerans]|uniref:TIGR03619 family F420-dependent LLM class oxidoreductase n=1 Tax=Bailinhaonella thermotolerans TaxID=1070861 RepID=A0A3A4A718_9ACTN|nr:TIGR03619 family F420-dependent LLM class oxidoreductase [Bailinhaonella thermotolerans]RJL21693.1 TIGR03619 family F420-dependent LLM class oxidoreductase [Bailinhaonella thermotolerans]
MRLGVTMFATDRSMPIAELARAAEERGFSSVYVPEHTHIPVSRRTPPATGDAELADHYKRSLDPLVALAFAAAATSRLRLGTGILLPAQREPLVTAKAVATLDLLSGGRFTLGVGFGWNVEEIEDHGVPYGSRRDVAREHVLAMRGLWREEEFGFEGEHVRFETSWSWPKPVGDVPILLGGGAGPKLFAHVAEYGDGWMPIGGKGIRQALPALREAWAAAGRDGEPEVVPVGTRPSEGKLAYFAEMGIKEVVCDLPSAPADRVLPILDEYAKRFL